MTLSDLRSQTPARRQSWTQRRLPGAGREGRVRPGAGLPTEARVAPGRAPVLGDWSPT